MAGDLKSVDPAPAGGAGHGGGAAGGARPRAPGWLARVALVLCLVSGGVIAMDAVLLEPGWIEVRRSLQTHPKLRVNGPDLTLVHLSDLHVAGIGRRERRAIALVNLARADVIVVTGDLSRPDSRPEDVEEFLSALQSRRGKFIVWGEIDHRTGVADSWGPDVVQRAGFVLLSNDSRRIDTPAGRLYLAGIETPGNSRDDDVERATAGIPTRDLCILLTHAAVVPTGSAARGIDFVLAGPAAAGRVRLPMLGAIGLSAGAGTARDGWVVRKETPPVNISRGLGCPGIPLRFLDRPVIDVITLRGGSDRDPRRRGASIRRG